MKSYQTTPKRHRAPEGPSAASAAGPCKTVTALARAAGVPRRTVIDHTASPAWAELGDWPIELTAYLAWRAKHVGPSQVAGADEPQISPERRAKWRLSVARAAKLELERSILAGAYLRRADIDRGRVERVLAVKSRLLALPRSVAPELAGQTIEEIERRLTVHVLAMLRDFAGEGGADVVES